LPKDSPLLDKLSNTSLLVKYDLTVDKARIEAYDLYDRLSHLEGLGAIDHFANSALHSLSKTPMAWWTWSQFSKIAFSGKRHILTNYVRVYLKL
jgi:hypothetical protein